MRKYIIVGVIICMALALNTRLKVVTYHIEDTRVEKTIKLLLITDLHACDYGEKQIDLVEKIDEVKPDAILLGGDIYDHKMSMSVTDLLQAIKAYNTYYVTGNHEIWSGNYQNFKNELQVYGVTILAGTSDIIDIGEQKIQIAGVDDISINTSARFESTIYDQLGAIHVSDDMFTVLLAHRPELIESYQSYGFDLVLSGHAHGGQWRIPFLINGVYAPNQGFFPKYAGGYYIDEKLIVSRGLAKETTRVPRIFNRPELVVIEIN